MRWGWGRGAGVGAGCVMEVGDVGHGEVTKKKYTIYYSGFYVYVYFFVSFMIFLCSKGCINYYFNQIFWR